MRRRWLALATLIVLALVLGLTPVSAQGAPLLAFLNSAGQLVIASGDGGYRWIVTNPGEPLHQPLGFAWSPGGRLLFFAVGAGDASLRVADPVAQAAREIGRVAAPATGGQWTGDGQAVLVASGNRVLAFPISGGEPVEVAAAPDVVTLRSPLDAGAAHPQLPAGRNLTPSGQYLFYPAGAQVAVGPTGSAPVMLPGGDPRSAFSGLWSDAAPLVAYPGYGASSFLAVANAASGASVTMDSGRSAPVTPLGWRPGTAQLLYRDATSTVRIADLGCLVSGCGGNPLDVGEPILPASATEVQTDGAWVYYLDGEAVRAVSLGCVGSGGCLNSAVTLGANAAPQTLMDVSGGSLAYTAYTYDSYNAADREARVVRLGCLGNPPSCAPQTALAGAVAGLVSPDGGYVVVEQVGGPLGVLRLADGALAYLSDAAPGLLTLARWAE